MSKTLVVVFVCFVAVAVANAASSVTGLTFNAPLGQVFYGQIASFNICSGQAITAIYAEVNWGDGTIITGAEIPDPLYQARLLGSHSYAQANTYPVTIRLTATCFRDTGDAQFRWKDIASGTATAIVPPEVGTSGIVLSPATVVRGGTVTGTITIASPAPSWGTLVQLGSSDNTAATVSPGVIVQGTGNTATFTISTLAFTGGARNVTITVVSGGVARSAVLRVR